MSELTFVQPAKRNYIVPVVMVAVVILGVAAFLIHRMMPQRTFTATVMRTLAHPVKTVYEAPPQTGSFKLLKVHQGESDLYLIPTVRVENHLDVPIYLKDFTLTFETAEGEMHTSAIEKNDLDSVYASFPEIKPLMAKPLPRDTSVAPGTTVEGTILAQFPIPQSMWDQRKSATVTIDFYHAPSMTIPVPKP